MEHFGYKRPILGIFSIVMVLILSRCNTGDLNFNDIQLPNYQGEFSLPLGSAKFTVSDLITDLEDAQLDIDTTQAGVITLVYRDTTDFTEIDQVVEVDNVSNEGLIESPAELANSPVSIDSSFTVPLEFLYPIDEGDELDSIVYTQGTITITFESEFDVPMSFTYKLNDIVDRTSGDSLEITSGVAANGSGSVTQSLSGFKTIAVQNAANENVFTGSFTGTLEIPVGGSVFITDEFRYQVDITDVEYETIYGYFGQKEFDLQSESVEMDFFDELDGRIRFGDPEIRLIVNNSFGVTMGLELSQVSASSSEGDTVNLAGEVIEDYQFINGPSIFEVGDSVTSTISINNDNSNLPELLAIAPNVINFSVNALSNFSNSSSIVPEEDRNFVNENSTATSFFEIEIPLDLNVEGITRSLDYDLDKFEFDEADSINLRIKSVNTMPLSGTIDLQFLDADSTVVYSEENVSVFTSPVVPSGSKVTEASESIDYIKLYDEGLEALFNQPTIRLLINVNSYDFENDTFVKIYFDYELEVFLGVETTLDVEL